MERVLGRVKHGTYKGAKQGFYTLLNPEKYAPPVDNYMGSTFLNENGKLTVQFKSSLEMNAVKYADFNKFIVKWSLEPFAIVYIKPQDGKRHRYYPDMFLEFENGSKMIVEVKSKAETLKPEFPKVKSASALAQYARKCATYMTNQAKWKSAYEFCRLRGYTFCVLTEDQLKF